jgi:hypothetical protein
MQLVLDPTHTEYNTEVQTDSQLTATLPRSFRFPVSKGPRKQPRIISLEIRFSFLHLSIILLPTAMRFQSLVVAVIACCIGTVVAHQQLEARTNTETKAVDCKA